MEGRSLYARRRHSPDEYSGSTGPQVADQAVEQLLAEVVEDTQPQPERLYNELFGTGAIVTGGATAIGRAIALGLARHGVHNAFNYFDGGDGRIEADAERTAHELRSMQVTVVCRPCDVRDTEAVGNFVAEADQALSGLHILVNNAGIARDRALWRMEDEEWRDVL